MERRWLKSLRKEKGLTLRELGERIGLSECYVSNIEAGTRKCSGMDVSMLTKIATATGTRVSKLLEAEARWIGGRDG